MTEQRKLTEQEMQRQNAYLDGFVSGIPGSLSPEEFEGLALSRLQLMLEQYLRAPGVFTGQQLRTICQEVVDLFSGKLTP